MTSRADWKTPALPAIMELLSGGTLRHLLESNGRIEPRLALTILEGVCSAVAEAHRHRLVHRDIKPENIFLVESGRQVVAKVLDFGIAKRLSVATTIDGRRETGSRILLGTLDRHVARAASRPVAVESVGHLEPRGRRALDAEWQACGLDAPARSRPLAAEEPCSEQTQPAGVDVFNRALAIDPAERPPTPKRSIARLQPPAVDANRRSDQLSSLEITYGGLRACGVALGERENGNRPLPGVPPAAGARAGCCRRRWRHGIGTGDSWDWWTRAAWHCRPGDSALTTTRRS